LTTPPAPDHRGGHHPTRTTPEQENAAMPIDTAPLNRNPHTRLRNTVRKITAEFDVTDDLIREVPVSDRTPSDGTFRPTSVAVEIEMRTARFVVELTGPMYRRHGFTAAHVGTRRYVGDHYLDADLCGNQIVTDAVLDTLDAHGLLS
jgi:hypothetical protein